MLESCVNMRILVVEDEMELCDSIAKSIQIKTTLAEIEVRVVFLIN